MNGGLLSELLEESRWLYRGVPAESPEVEDVSTTGEVSSPRPERTGEVWRQMHIAGDTNTGYTSWTTDRSIAEAAAESICDNEELPGGYRILRVRISTLVEGKVFRGRDDEYEVLIEGTVERIEFSDDANVEEENDN